MGQKTNPLGLRVTLTKKWGSVLYGEKDYGGLLIEDIKVRKLIDSMCVTAQVSKVVIERPSEKSIIVNIFVRRPGIIIGRGGADIDKLKKQIMKITSNEVYINVHEVKKPSMDAKLISLSIASQLEKRISFRKAMKKAMQECMKSGGGVRGIKISCGGRLGGAEIARTEWYKEGRVPLHTLRADIDYATSQAHTTYGVIGVKTWVYKGEYKDKKRSN